MRSNAGMANRQLAWLGWCNSIVLNAPSPSEETSDDSKDSFCEELEHVFYHFSQYNMKNEILM